MKAAYRFIPLALLCGCASVPAMPSTPAASATSEPPPPVHEPPSAPIDRSGLSDVGMDAPLDYADPAMWACRPGNEPDECQRNLDATEIRADATRTVVSHRRAEAAPFDCFYVYPTVKLSGSGNLTDFSDTGMALVNDPLQSQAARFSRICQLYAPLYRQIGIDRSSGTTRPAAGAKPELAIADVRAAFKYYLEHLSQGRKFVLLGHSQGAGMLTTMMQQDVDGVPEVRARMISALLIGGGVQVAEGKRTGGSFQNIPTCSAPGETGCVIAYASYSKEAPPAVDSRFAAATESGKEMACTEPGALAGNAGPYKGSYFRSSVSNPTFRSDQPLPEGLETPFALYPAVLEGECVKRDGLHYLEISLARQPDDTRDTRDTRGIPPYRSKALEAAGVGLHVVDFNLPLEDLIAAVSLQARAALE